MAYKDIRNIFPISIGELEVNILEFKDIEWYSKEVFKEYFNEYLEYKATSKNTEESVARHLKLELASRVVGVQRDRFLRTIVKLNGESIGGITFNMVNKKMRILEIAYWINPSQQSKGYTTLLLENIIERLKNNGTIKAVKLQILENNKASKRVAQKLNFDIYKVEKSKVQGVNKIVYMRKLIK